MSSKFEDLLRPLSDEELEKVELVPIEVVQKAIAEGIKERDRIRQMKDSILRHAIGVVES